MAEVICVVCVVCSLMSMLSSLASLFLTQPVTFLDAMRLLFAPNPAHFLGSSTPPWHLLFMVTVVCHLTRDEPLGTPALV